MVTHDHGTGCDGITTNCGFLSLIQDEIAAACEVPVATSALMQAPMIQSTLPPGRRVGLTGGLLRRRGA